MDGLDGFHAQDFPREDLDDVSAVFQGRNDAVEVVVPGMTATR